MLPEERIIASRFFASSSVPLIIPNITINVDKINSEQDIKKLAYQIGDIITERNKRDWKKVR